MAFKDIFSSDSDALEIPPENRLDLAVTALSKYYMSAASENELKNYAHDVEDIAASKEATDAAALASRQETSQVLRKIRSILQDTTMGGLFVTQILQKFQDDETLKAYPNIDKIIKVKFEGHIESPVNATKNIDSNQGVNSQCGSLRLASPSQSSDQGAQAAADAASGTQSADVAGVSEPVDGGNAPGDPDAIDNPFLSAIIINDDRLTPGNNRNAAGSLFFNSIPTTEMSQCSPFIRITFITENDNFIDGAKRMSLYGFTAGSESDLSFFDKLAKEGGIDFASLSLKRDAGFDVTTDISVADVALPGMGDQEDSTGTLTIDKSRPSTSGIELFQSPQTLNNIGQAHGQGADGPLNPTAPLASLQRLTVDISGLGLATLCNKTASMEFILHDRTQMKLIAPIIGASSFAGTHVEIEYGWMHPQASITSAGNVYANFLNSLRSKSLFNIQVADISILEDGQVRVNLKLASRGAAEMSTVPAACGVSKISAAMIAPFLNKVLSQMSHMKSKSFQALSTTETENASGPETAQVAARTANVQLLNIQRGFNALSGFNSPQTMIDLGIYRTLLSNLRSGASASAQAAAVKSAVEIINEIMTTIDENSDPSATQVTLATELEGKRSRLMQLDIFDNGTNTPVQEAEAVAASTAGAPPVDANSESADNNRGTSSPTLGSVLLTYIGRPLQAIGKWDEVQFLFYPFNAHSAAMCRSNIANFRLTGFDTFLTDIIATRPFISTAEFAEKLFKSPCGPETISHPNYWAGETYTQVSRESLTALSTREERLNAIQNARISNDDMLSKIYDKMGRSISPKFELPDITMLTECVPARDVEEGQSKSILRLHVFDAKAGIPIEASLLSQVIQQNEVALRVEAQGAEPSPDAGSEDEKDEAVTASSQSDPVGAGLLAGLFEGIIGKGESPATESSPVSHSISISKISANMIKDAIKSIYPSITFGTQFTNVYSFGMASNTGGAVNQVLLLNSIEQNMGDGDAPSETSPVNDVFVIPTNATLQTAGFPAVQYGQKYYIDMGTGTTADNFYYVVGIRHTLTPGSFESTFQLTYNGSGTSRSLRTAMKSVAGVVYPGDTVT